MSPASVRQYGQFMTSNEETRNGAEIVAAEWSAVLAYGPDRIDLAVP